MKSQEYNELKYGKRFPFFLFSQSFRRFIVFLTEIPSRV